MKSMNKFTLPESTTFKTDLKILRVMGNLAKDYQKIPKNYLTEEDIERAAGVRKMKIAIKSKVMLNQMCHYAKQKCFAFFFFFFFLK